MRSNQETKPVVLLDRSFFLIQLKNQPILTTQPCLGPCAPLQKGHIPTSTSNRWTAWAKLKRAQGVGCPVASLTVALPDECCCPLTSPVSQQHCTQCPYTLLIGVPCLEAFWGSCGVVQPGHHEGRRVQVHCVCPFLPVTSVTVRFHKQITTFGQGLY